MEREIKGKVVYREKGEITRSGKSK